MFIEFLQTNPRFYFTWIIIIAFSICVHEFAHAAMALRCGDDTAAQEGHLSLNPMVQMGPMSLVFLFLIGIAWGAVPVDVSLLRKRGHEAWVAFAGPLANLLILMVAGLAFVIVFLVIGTSESMKDLGALLREAWRYPNTLSWQLGKASPVLSVCYEAGRANAVLFLFNMLPVPLLDGWTVLAHFFPKMKWLRRETASTITNVFILAVFVTPLGSYVWYGGERVSVAFMMVVHAILGAAGLGS